MNGKIRAKTGLQPTSTSSTGADTEISQSRPVSYRPNSRLVYNRIDDRWHSSEAAGLFHPSNHFPQAPTRSLPIGERPRIPGSSSEPKTKAKFSQSSKFITGANCQVRHAR
jgi:hypothetical protein